MSPYGVANTNTNEYVPFALVSLVLVMSGAVPLSPAGSRKVVTDGAAVSARTSAATRAVNARLR
ncbi:MAG: hypothetical protein E6F98_06030 [Actinobacteria bacterium]|nr:MAG: hypothetical protein E6F98_06030 [Actinomycetota bacterium]